MSNPTTYKEWFEKNKKHMQPQDLDAWCEAAWVAGRSAALVTIDVEQAVDRFLGWKLPMTFAPDCGISFTPICGNNEPFWPIGTNLFNAVEAKQMIRYVLNMPEPEPTLDEVVDKLRCVTEDPMWDAHAEVSKKLLKQALNQLYRLQGLEK